MYELIKKIPWQRVAAARTRIDTAFSLRQPDYLPLDFRVAGFDWQQISVRQRMLDHELALRERLEYIAYIYEHFPDNDFLPVLDADTGEVVLPGALGAEYIYPENNMPWCTGKPVITDIREDTEKLREVKIKDQPVVKHALARIDYFLKETGRKIPVSFFDVTSPLTAAAKLMDSSTFFLAMADQPEEFSSLLDLIADKIIELMRLQMEIIGDPALLNPIMNTGVASGTGCVIYDDYNSMLSSEMYRSLCASANGKILTAMGGGHLHSCGPVWNVVDPILEFEGLRSFDFVFLKNRTKTAADLLAIKSKCRHKVPFISKSMPGVAVQTDGSRKLLSSERTLDDEENITVEWLRQMNEGGGFALKAAGTPQQGARLRRLIREASS